MIPIVDRALLASARRSISEVTGLPALVPPRPYLWNDVHGSCSKTVYATPKRTNTEDALLCFLPPHEVVILSSRGALYHSWLVPKPRQCFNDSTQGPALCSLFKGTVLAVDLTDDGAWAYDVLSIRGVSIRDESFRDRRERLHVIKSCVPELKLDTDDKRADSSRLWKDE